MGTLSNLTVSGNISATLVTGTLTTNAQPNITSVGTLSNLSVTGNISAGNANLGNLVTGNFFTGTLTTNAQPNITSVGNLTSLTVTGNLQTANISGNIYPTAGNGDNGIIFPDNPGSGFGDGAFIKYYAYSGEKTRLEINVSNDGNSAGGPDYIWLNASGGTVVQNELIANFFSGDGSNITNILSSSITGQVANANIASTVYTNAQPNITSVGTLSNLTVTGNIISGNANLGNSLVANFFTGTLTTNAQPNITSVGNLTSLTVDGVLSVGDFSVSGNFTVGNANIINNLTSNNSTVNLLLTGNTANFSGNLISANANLGNIATANFFTGTLTTNAQPNITSVGTLTGLISNGVINFTGASNVSLGNISNVKITGGTANYIVQTDGTGNLSFVQPPETINIVNDTTTNTSYYPIYSTTTSGSLTTATISTTKFTFNPSTGEISATNFNSLSDENYKINVSQITNALDVINKLNGVNFDWIDGGSSHGFIAQFVEKILPNAVSVVNGKKTLNYSAIIPFLVEAIKTQQITIENCYKEITELKQQVEFILQKLKDK